MIRNPKDLQRYSAHERANHWAVGISFILLALSGLAFFHPAFWPLTQLFGGGVWARILHPFLGLIMAGAFLVMFFRFKALNAMTPEDKEWLSRAGEMMSGNDHNMPEQGKYNGGQKAMFWVMALCMLLLFVSGILLWRAYFDFPVGVVRLGAVVHAAIAAIMIAMIFVHVYAALWVRGTVRAMVYGTVTRAWAKQHHRAWYRQVTGKS
ncbi:formate dehydrogenase subunit gamma [Sulfuritalea hydrogenivorans]|uniref:Formate dehydrogenase gamma subunit n=1 Tax=Sulfuritalea hydrogenivorans sk43H TaxID=1223802 RepID=W0S9Z2_9PROT|nr:formate dehydrogenase subunit gamma [Sulfuritalea hydrogenivorans]MDK9713933.1 formate dehydrogenase subunit gamma [Sulfuritalea sp.]BAO28029.1 formate dehydrogenase gamma subunit [Sulfuritalea hydrogenivorans sk43H]